MLLNWKRTKLACEVKGQITSYDLTALVIFADLPFFGKYYSDLNGRSISCEIILHIKGGPSDLTTKILLKY